jgi:hypothetical protein
MNGRRYTVLGYAVWKGGRWYLHWRFPRARRTLVAGGLALALAALLARRGGR